MSPASASRRALRVPAPSGLLRTALLVMLAPVVCSAPAHGTTIDPFVWEELILGADFVGIVECTVAGGNVAKYKVIETWKGPAGLKELSIGITPNYCGGQFKIVLVGQRLFVAAFKDPPCTMTSSFSAGGVPLWWRQIPYDFRLPLWQGSAPVRADGKFVLREFQDDELWNAQVREIADGETFTKNLLKAKPEDQETCLLKAVTTKVLCLREPYTQTGPRKAVHQALSAAKTPGAVLEAILNATLPTDEPEKAVSTIIGRGGMHGTLRYLEGMGKAKGPLSIELRDRMIKDLRRKLADGGPSTHEDKAETRPSAPEVAVDIEALRKTFAKGPREEGFGRAFLELTRRDPATVAAYLVQWELPAERRPLPAGNSTRGYDLGSLFTHACGKDRPVHLRTLLKAKDPFIRVAGAVYLCFEEPRAGAKELKALQAIEGDPGAWAALTLARRGDASAVPRALQVFAERRKQDAWTNLHHNLCAHLLVLLSNSAASSGLAQPLRPESADAASIETYLSTEDHAQLLKWWDDHKATIQLLDPWMPILEKQKID